MNPYIKTLKRKIININLGPMQWFIALWFGGLVSLFLVSFLMKNFFQLLFLLYSL